MINLNTTFPLGREIKSGLPVLVDLNWHGKIATSDNGGFIPSRAAMVPVRDAEPVHEVTI
jgi:hypothetical protein